MKKNIVIVSVLITLVVFSIIFAVKNSSRDRAKEASDEPYANYDRGEISGEVIQSEKPVTINNLENQKKTMTATLSTNKGDIVIEFFEKDAPRTVENFLKLARGGFYDGVKFHRVIKGFMIQAGDPLSKDDSKSALWGTGGPGYKFADEIDVQSALYKDGYLKGIVAMANAGPDTNGSQFFIMHVDYPLPPSYTIFARVTAGGDVVDKIAVVPVNSSDRPLEAIVIKSVTLQ